MKRGIPRRRRVRVCPFGQQELDKRTMTTMSRHEQRAPTIRRRIVDIRTGGQEQSRRVNISLPGCK